MNDTFYEQIVSRSTGALAMVLRIVIYVFLVVLVLLSLLRVPLAFFIVIPLAGLSFYYVIPRLSVEYEYALLNSELNIDVIFSKSSRKHILTIDLREAEKAFPKSRLDINHYREYKCRNYMGEDESKAYVFVLHLNGVKTLLFLTPDEEMLSLMEKHMPRKSQK